MKFPNPYKRLFYIMDDSFASDGRGASAFFMLIVLVSLTVFASVSLIVLLVEASPVVSVPILILVALYLLYRWIRYTIKDPS